MYPNTSSYALTETGTKAYNVTQSGSHVTGAYSLHETGTDSYTIAESGGTSSGGGGGGGGGSSSGSSSNSSSTWGLTLTGVDNYTISETGNEFSSPFSRTTTGSGTDTLSESGSLATTYYNHSPSTNYSVVESGNYLSGALSLTETGTDRYGLIQAFNNVSDAVTSNGNGPGDVDYSPVGTPFHIGAASPYWGHGPAANLTAAASDAAFNELGLQLLHEYCVPKGTPIIHKGVRIAIEDFVAGGEVSAVYDRDPDGAIASKQVLQFFENQPARLWHIGVNGKLIRITGNHPIYVRGKGFIAASLLKPGDELRSYSGKPAFVTSVLESDEIEPVFNVRVADFHTYFVGSLGGNIAVLVHNESPGGPSDAVLRSGETLHVDSGAAKLGGEKLDVSLLADKARAKRSDARAGHAESSRGAKATADAGGDKRSHLPSESRGKWVKGTKGNGVFEYFDTAENRAAGVAGKRVRFDKGRIGLGGFPAEWYYGGSAKSARVKIDNVKGTKVDDFAADAEMRKKLKDPNWKRPAGYTWNHAGGEGSTTMELVETGPHRAVHHEGAASRARANTRANSAVARGMGALTAYINIRDALKAAGALEPDYEVVEDLYYFLDEDGSVYYLQEPGWLRSWVTDPKKVFVAGPREGETEDLTAAEIQQHRDAAEAQFGKLIPGTIFREPRFIPGTERKTLPYFEDGLQKGYVDEDGIQRIFEDLYPPGMMGA